MSLHIETKTLPDSLRNALRSIGYHAADVSVRGADTYTPSQGGGAGQRAFVMAVELATGRTETHQGSWGGANAFNPGNAVDLDGASRPIAPGFAIIQGSTGNHTFASVLLHPSNIAAMLPVAVGLTERQRYHLNCYASLTSAGRKDEFARGRANAPTADELTELQRLGMIKINKAGAVSITTLGKNNRGRGLL